MNRIKKLFLFLFISIFCQTTGLAQMIVWTALVEANIAASDPAILHSKTKIEKVVTSSFIITKKGNKKTKLNMYFDEEGNNTEIAYFFKNDSIPYKRDLKFYGDDLEKEVVLERPFGEWDTTKVTTSHFVNELLVSQDILNFNRVEIMNSGIAEIRESKKLSQFFYYYDDQNNLLEKVKNTEGKEMIEESNSYIYNRSEQVVKKGTKTFMFEEKSIENRTFIYDGLGNISQERITEDTMIVVHNYENSIKRKTEIKSINGEVGIVLLYDFEGKQILTTNPEEDYIETVIREYKYDDEGNWVKKNTYTQKNEEVKELRNTTSREIFYRE